MVEDEEEEIEESEEFKKSVEVSEPTQKQRDDHEMENHAVYRNWCPVCIQSRGLGTQHRKSRKTLTEQTQDGPKICSEFFFMSTDEKSAPMLALKNSRSKRLAATALPSKGVTEFGVKFFAEFIADSGLRKFINFSDGEHSMVALKNAAMRACAGVEAQPKECPVGDHQANGDIEVGIREIKRQMRALRLALERKLGDVLDDRDPLLFWMPAFAGDISIAEAKMGKRHQAGSSTSRAWSTASSCT